MKTQVTFKDSLDDSEVNVSVSSENSHYIITIGENDVWFSPADFSEFLNEAQRFYIDNEHKRK